MLSLHKKQKSIKSNKWEQILSSRKNRRIFMASLLVAAIALPSTVYAINKVFNEVWADGEAQTFQLTFQKGNGPSQANMPETQTCTPVNGSCKVTVPAQEPTASGGWKFISYLSNGWLYPKPGDEVTLTENHYLVAKWSKVWTLSYDLNEGTGSASAVQDTCETGSESLGSCRATITADDPTRDGYSFIGWGEQKTSTSGVHKGDSYSIDTNKTLYALWDKNEETFTATFDLNGSDFGTAPDPVTCVGKTGCYIDLPAATPTRTGYAFHGWSTNKNDVATEYFNYAMPGGHTYMYGNQTYYAIWLADDSQVAGTFTLSFDANYGKNAPSPVSCNTTGETCQVTIPTTTPSRVTTSGTFEFVGWADYKNVTEAKYQPGETMTLTGNKTIYAIWGDLVNDEPSTPTSSTFYLTYNANGGSGAPGTQSCTTTSTACSVTISSVEPTRSGYTFKGWGLTSGATSARYQSNNSMSLSSNQTLYAVWQQNQVAPTTHTYTLSYDANGGSGAPSMETRNNITATSYNFTISSTVPTRSGYKFTGWKKSGESTIYTVGSNVTATSSNPNVALVAQWEEKSSTNPDSGNTGNTGNTGDSGNTGNTGNTGSTGDSGNTGNTGNSDDEDNTTYTILPGSSSNHILSSDETFIIKGSGNLSKFVNFKIDGNIVAETNYTKASGSTIITVSPAYLDTLSAGTHTATMVWSDGEASTDFVVAASEEEVGDDESSIVVPKTSTGAPDTGDFTLGDKGLIAGISAAVLGAASVVVYIIHYFAKRQNAKVHFGKH